jgi:hypothetical protein
MTVFTSKDAFVGLGLEQVNPSSARTSQDCCICTKPLAVHNRGISQHDDLRNYHPLVRVSSCGHVHGQECLEECLEECLNVGNSCSTCDRVLFELTGDAITQQDVNDVVQILGRKHGEAHIMIAVTRMMEKQENDHVVLRRVHEQGVAKQNMKDAGVQDNAFMLSDDDVLYGDTEMDFGEEDGDKEYVMEGEESEESSK